MKGKILFALLLVSLMLSVVACNNPEANESSIQVVNQYNHNCNLYVKLDGGNQQTITGTSYTFQNISPGNHTLNFSTSGTSGTGSNCGSSPCVFGNGQTIQDVNFNTSAGYEYNATLQAVGSDCGTITVNTAGL